MSRSVVALCVSVFAAATAALCGITALGKEVYDTSDRELDRGLLGLAEFAPAFVASGVAGQAAAGAVRPKGPARGRSYAPSNVSQLSASPLS